MRTGLMALSGHNLRAVVALCRWASATGVPLHLVASGPQDPIALTDHAARVFLTRTSAALDLPEILGWIGQLCRQQGYERVILVPSTEYFNRFLLRHRAALEAAGGVVPLVDEALYTRVSDKQAFAALCSEHGIAVPAAQALPPAAPFVAKPRRYLSSAGGQIKPWLITGEAEREDFLRRETVDDYFFQTFVEGQSLYLLAHLARDGRVVASAQENLIQQPGGASIVLARAHDFHLEPEAQPYLRMLRAVGFHGLVMIEVRRCRHSARAVMIEANPRLWGPQQFMLDRGVDPFTPLFSDHGLAVPRPFRSERPGRYYFWSGGLSARSPACVFHQFSAERFLADYPSIAAADLFARDDTRRLHQHELAAACNEP